jgi:hypothetical protein
MAKLRYLQLTGTTDGSGDLTVNATKSITGWLYAVEWVLGTFAAGVDAVLSEQSRVSGVARTLLTLTDANANAIYYPRYIVHSEAGAALTGTSGGDRAMAYIVGIPRLVVAQGGSAKVGSMFLYYLVD